MLATDETVTLREMDTNIRPLTAEHAVQEADASLVGSIADLKAAIVPVARRTVKQDKQSKKAARFQSATIGEGRENVLPAANDAIRHPAARRSLRNRMIE